ncbi:ABC transporter ATP-binding protein [Oceanicella sp. SM1341]|uniref:ABC transporter ATP-binding protein n=1 Tax=Oceanicella sp. SM1341 TaxID=1548889 RepID=UPI000E52DDAA|nr:ABC transporter ATP-binding protein [Oceanicella sp. SM1341]
MTHLVGKGLAARHGSGRRSGTLVLDGVDFHLRPGEIVGIIGPNGAGKSTLLRLLAGLQEPEAGRVTLDGHTPSPRQRARTVAYLEQGAAVHWPLSVRETVALGRLPHRGRLGPADPAADTRAVDAALQATGVSALAQRRADTLSGGERMRVLLARALAVEAPLLLADEPVAALDPHHQLHILELLRARARAGGAVALILHDLALAARFCDRLMLLVGGRVLADGPPAEVLGDIRLAQAFSITVLRGTEGGAPWLLPWTRLPLPRPEEDMT